MPFLRHFWVRAASRYNRACRACGATITLAQEVETGRWHCFDINPVALRTRNGYETHDGVYEQLDGQDLHTCGSGRAA